MLEERTEQWDEDEAEQTHQAYITESLAPSALTVELFNLRARNKDLEDKELVANTRNKMLEQELEELKCLPSEQELKQFIERELKLAQMQISELKSRNQALQDEVDFSAHLQQRVKELEAELTKKDEVKPIVIQRKKLPPAPPNSDATCELEALKRMNKTLQEEVDTQRTTTISPTVVASILADKMKLKEMEEKIRQLELENTDLKQRLQESAVSMQPVATNVAPVNSAPQQAQKVLAAKYFSFAERKVLDQVNAREKELQTTIAVLEVFDGDDMADEAFRQLTLLKAQQTQSLNEAKDELTAVAGREYERILENHRSKVLEAEEKVRKRQDLIRHAMRKLNERDREFQVTTATIAVLEPLDGEDETHKKLALRKAGQSAKLAEARQLLVMTHDHLKRESEALQEAEAELLRHTANRGNTSTERLQKAKAELSRHTANRGNTSTDECVLS